ncbi:MAG: NADH:ubiquinone reductase (Na(+)-transporting) subunit B, partial [Planctomycetes bacterium]|nr:NADH:ubiquinone reductase (Na(+)-transporting) subunit B [Planctomycetota bacterium]
HIRDGADLKRVMSTVVIALLPCVIFGMYNAGYQSLTQFKSDIPVNLINCLSQGALRLIPIYLVTLIAGGAVEVLFAVVRKHEINEGFLVTSALFPLILPPTLPWWMAAVGIIFGVFIGKEVFGGTGMNVFNPALTGRCFLFFAYPAQMSGDIWVAKPAHSFMDIFSSQADAISRATPLSMANSNQWFSSTDPYKWSDLFWGLIPGSIGETSAFCVLLGAIVLIATGVGSYKTILGCVLGCLAASSLFYSISGEYSRDLMRLAPHFHLVAGGFAFGAVFMATDPVSSPTTGTGKWIYGIGIGMLTVLVRAVNPAFPEGMMLSILFMNLWAPLIDHYIVEHRIKRRLARVEGCK